MEWNFSYRFPGKDGAFGNPRMSAWRVRRIRSRSTPDDPKGQDDVCGIWSGSAYCPSASRWKVLGRAKDVLHPIRGLPAFRVKMDMVSPAHGHLLLADPHPHGKFRCALRAVMRDGALHHARSRVIVEEEKDFQAWLAAQPTYAQTRAAGRR